MPISRCLCCCPLDKRSLLFSIADALYPQAEHAHIESAIELRRNLIQEGDAEVAVLAGYSERGVSDINLCAAILLDGCVGEAVLVVDEATGSLLSRAKSAGIARVYEAGPVQAHPVAQTQQHTGNGGPSFLQRAQDGRDGPSERRAKGKPGGERGLEGRADPDGPVAFDGLGNPDNRDGGAGRAAGAPLVVLCSGRGGVGKTAIAATAACVAASWGMRVALLDLDLANGNLYSCFGLACGGDLSRLSDEGMAGMDALAQQAGERIRLWGPCALPEMAEVAAPHIAAAIEYARAHADLVIADTASTTTDAVAEALQRADRAVIVYDGRYPALVPLSRMGGLAVRLGVARTRIMRLENHADPYAKPDFALARAEVGLEVARPLRVFEGGGEAAQTLGEGLAGELARYTGDFSQSVASCLAQILSELGCLPDCEEARRAAREPSVKRRFWRFARTREAG